MQRRGHVSRRGKGEGSVYKRADGSWVAQLLLPDGKRRYLYGKTRATVYARLSEAQQRLKVGQALPKT